MFIFIKTTSPHKGNLRPERIRNSTELLFFCVVHADEALGATCAPQRNMHLEDTFFQKSRFMSQTKSCKWALANFQFVPF